VSPRAHCCLGSCSGGRKSDGDDRLYLSFPTPAASRQWRSRSGQVCGRRATAAVVQADHWTRRRQIMQAKHEAQAGRLPRGTNTNTYLQPRSGESHRGQQPEMAMAFPKAISGLNSAVVSVYAMHRRSRPHQTPMRHTRQTRPTIRKGPLPPTEPPPSIPFVICPLLPLFAALARSHHTWHSQEDCRCNSGRPPLPWSKPPLVTRSIHGEKRRSAGAGRRPISYHFVARGFGS
jgi:hypothetical protein